MKTNFKKAIMPLAVVVLGAAAAFATNAAKQNEKSEADVTHGFYYDVDMPPGERCVIVNNIDCSDVTYPFICTDSSLRQLWKTNENGLVCSDQLFQKP